MTRESGNTWGAVATATLVASVVGGAFLLKQPLESRRPQQNAALIRTSTAGEIVPARLWQDPLHAIQSHYNGTVPHIDKRKVVPRHVSLPFTIKELSEKSAKARQRELRLLVMMPGGPYAEDREERRRQRHAVVSALTENDYVPEDAERIGYVEWPISKEFSRKDECEDDNGSVTSLVGSRPSTLIGFGFYKRAIEANKKESNGKSKVEHPWESILVLWLNSQDFDNYPLQRLSVLMADLDDKRSCAGLESPPTVLLGPATSGALAEMGKVKGCKSAAKNWLKCVREKSNTGVSINDYIAQLHILSPRATVPLHWLFRDRKEHYRTDSSCDSKCVDARFGDDIGVASFNSVVARDNLVLKEILNEIVARGARAPLVAIVSEQDSAYGRLLDDILDEEVDDLQGQEFAVMEYGYLRGVDGELPPGSSILRNALRRTNDDESPSDQTTERIETLFKTSAGREPAFGVAQLDYVRRLADHIAYDLSNSDNHEHDSDNGGPVEEEGDRPVVIGILGTDVYDKLLILQALRERLPTATFFTTDLDARLTEPDVYAWSRNLIVGSSYGFTVEKLEGAGFRDSYQTALYRAVTLALDINKKKHEETAPCPRLFEIGRTGAVDITEHRESCTKGAYERVHGGIPYIRSKSAWLRWIFSALLVLAPLFALTIYALVRGRVLDNQRTSFRGRAHYQVAKIGGGSIVLLGILIWYLKKGGYEPWPFFEGVSSIPTLILHLTTVVFAYAIIDIAMGRISQAHRDIRNVLRLPSSSGNSTWSFRAWLKCSLRKKLRSGPWIWVWKRNLSGVREFPEKDAEECWKRYLRYSDWPARVARISIPFVIASLIFVIVFGIVLPAPLLTRHLYWLVDPVRALAILAALFTVFFCSDTLKIGQAILRDLDRHDIGGWIKAPNHDYIFRQGRTMELVVRYTESVSPIAVLPFILMFLLIVARSPVFEGWVWTKEVLSLYAGFALYVLVQALRFQFEALRAKEGILDALDKYRFQVAGDPKESSRLEMVSDRIKGIRRGAFVPWTRNPIFQALLLPSGAYGVVALLNVIF